MDVQDLHQELKSKSSAKQKPQLMKKYFGGVCIRCYYIPTRKISYQIEDAVLVEDIVIIVSSIGRTVDVHI
jgi:hypothetical protein